MLSTLSKTLIALSLLSLASAQTYTNCDPLNSTCPEDLGLQTYTLSTDFTAGASSDWVLDDGTSLSYSDLGAAFTINSKGDAPTIHTNFYIQFGYVEVKMRAANGTGIVSSIVLESDDLDEIDWEWLGGNNTSVETNYFGKGNTTTYNRAIYYPVSTPVETFHTYAVNWTSESITWLIDGIAVRTLEYADANGGSNFPQTPCRINLGSWAAGASSSEGTVTWAGGVTDFSDAPFTMYVESVNIINYNPAVNYNWTDHTGSFESIQVVNHTVSSNSSTAAGGMSANIVSATASASGSTTFSSSTSKTTNAAAAKGSGSATTTTTTSSSSTASSSGTSFAQGSSSGATIQLDRTWTPSGLIYVLGFLVGFTML